MSKDTNIKPVINEFRQHYLEVLSQEFPEPYVRADDLRVSGFPYCGLKHLYKRLTYHTEKKMEGFGSKYFTGVGTVTHEVIQEWIGHGGRIYGRWLCTKCGSEKKFSAKNKCKKCKSLMQYEELTVKAFKHLSGHLDGIYKSKDGRYFVIDYKTSSVKTIRSQNKRRTLPYTYNVAQIEAYCALIELIFDIKISGWILLYIARDNPFSEIYPTGALVTEKGKKKMLEKIKLWDKHYRIVMRLKELKEIKTLIDEKPCKTIEFYEERYKTYNPCPLSVGGVCFNRSRLREALMDAWEERKPDWIARGQPKKAKVYEAGHAPLKVELGKYRHFKGAVYKLEKVLVSGDDDYTKLALYSNSSGTYYVQKLDRFFDTVLVENNEIMPRFKKL